MTQHPVSAWPPEGLEPLHGRLDRAAQSLLWSGATAALVTLGVLGRGSEASQVLGVDAVPLVVLSLLAAMLWVMFGLDRVVSACVHLKRARRAGFDWATLIEVACDRRGTTGDLIAGTGAAAALADELRRNLRSARLIATLVPLGAALALLLLFVMRLRWPGDAPSDALTAAGVGALALVGLAGRVAMQAFERMTLPRGRDATRLRPATELRVHATRWCDAQGGGAPAAESRAPAILVHGAQFLALLIAVAAFFFLGIVMVASLAGPAAIQLANPQYSGFERRHAVALALQRFALPADSGISALDAGIAFATMDFRRDVRPGPFVLRDRAPLPTPPWMDSTPRSIGDQTRGVQRIAGAWIDSVRRRLTPEELAWMRDVAAYPGWQYVRTVARAPAVDVIGGRFELPFGETGTAFDMPIASVSVYRGFARANAFRVRYYLETNRPDSAVLAAREVLSLGVRVAADARSVIEAMVGAIIAQEGRDQLERTYAVLRHPQRDTVLRVTRDAALRAADLRGGALQYLSNTDAARIVAGWRRIVGDADLMPAIRWDAAALLGLTTCTDARGILRGPSPEVRETFDAFLASSARWPSDSAMIQLMREGPQRRPSWASEEDARLGLRFAATVGSLLGTPYLAACVRFVGGLAF
jgi:hypothetical protein